MSRRITSTRAVARGVILAFLLAGLFGMHGLAHAAADCHSRAGAPAPIHHPVIQAMPVTAAIAAGPVISMPMPDATHGSKCVATVPRGLQITSLLTVVAIALIALMLPSASAADRRGREWLRGPPIAGVRLLQLVCVSRT